MKRIHLEIFEVKQDQQYMKPATFREGEDRKAAVASWAQEQSDLQKVPFECTLVRSHRGHELWRVKLGLRTFNVIAH